MIDYRLYLRCNSLSLFLYNAIKVLGDSKKIAAKMYFRLLLVMVKCYKAYLGFPQLDNFKDNLEFKKSLSHAM